jgi:plastocyanin
MRGGGPMRLLAALLVAVVLVAAAGCRTRSSEPDPVTRQITIHYSRFEPATLSVPHGVPVTILLVNRDPIGHEWLIGDAAFHERHRRGNEPQHGARATEVSIPPLGRAETTITFEQPGTYAYICHLPGHEAYGMVGTLTVT